MSPLPDGSVAALRALTEIWDRDRFLVIGASALACHLGLSWRGTRDLDLSVSSEPDNLAEDLEALGWRRQGLLQRWRTPDGTLVDVVPATPRIIQEGGFSWAEGGPRMSLAGFRLAFADARPFEVQPGFVVRVASLRSLVVLKMAAYLDRPWERDNDLADLAHILAGFLGIDAEERWSERIIALDLDFEEIGPFVLGEQLGPLVDPIEREVVLGFLARLEDPSDPLRTLYRMARRAPPGWSDVDRLGPRLLVFRRAFESTRAGA